jgi:hypothetical protein
MLTGKEIGMVHLASNKAGLTREQYGLVLRNTGGVESSKDLSQEGLENVMAVFEDAGFRHAGKPSDYWRSKVALRGSYCGARMERLLENLAARQKYDLAGLCRRFSGDRVCRVDKLTPMEAHRLANALRDIVAREEAAAGAAIEGSGKGAGGTAGGLPEGRMGAGMGSGSVPEPAGV